MNPGDALWPMPSAEKMHAAAETLGAEIWGAITPRLLLDAAITWLSSAEASAKAGVLDMAKTSLFHASYTPAVSAVHVAFEAHGLPVHKPGYGDWMDRVGGTPAINSGDALAAGDAEALGNFMQTLERGERFCTGYVGGVIRGGGMLRAARLLADLLDRGEWEPQWN